MSRAVLSTVLVASIKRRAFSTTVAAATGSEIKAAESSSTASSTTKKKSSSPAPSSSWVPDPVTGYYRPTNNRAEIDAAEMRENKLPCHKTQN